MIKYIYVHFLLTLEKGVSVVIYHVLILVAGSEFNEQLLKSDLIQIVTVNMTFYNMKCKAYIIHSPGY